MGRLRTGANEFWFDEMSGEVPSLSVRRQYAGNINQIPPEWPRPDGGVTAILSIRPWPEDLLRGRLDEQILRLCRTAPPGSKLNAWHEAGNLPQYRWPPFAGTITDPSLMTLAHQYMARLCAGTSASYGPVLCMRPENMAPWMPPGMGWYGLDIYDWPEFRWPGTGFLSRPRITARLDSWKREVRRVSRRGEPELAICETNSSRPRSRARWIRIVSQWCAANGCDEMVTFWSVTPGQGTGPWLPGRRDVIAALEHAAGDQMKRQM